MSLLSSRSSLWHLNVLCAAVALSLSACGGGGDGDSSAPAPTPMTLSGTVSIDGRLKNVVVCLDLNTNNACDVGEPASAATGADGAYAVTWDANILPAAQTSVAALIAPVATGTVDQSTTAIDMSAPDAAATTSAYVLKRPAGAGGDINPLTTLVQAGVAAGMTEAVARENAALQLGVATAKVDGYQDDPASDPAQVADNARWTAKFTALALEAQAPLRVVDQKADVTAMEVLNQLVYADSGNYFVQTLQRPSGPVGATGSLVTDARAGKIGGVVRPDTGAANSLYRGAYLTADGWKLCTRELPTTSATGNPSRSTYCDAASNLAFTKETAVSGQAMGDLVTRWQSQSSNRINSDGTSIAGLLGALGNATFPADAHEQVRTGLAMTPDILIDNTWSRGLDQARGTTLDQMVTLNPASAVVLPKANGTLSLALSTGLTKNLRVAFKEASSATAGAAQFYECDLDARGINLLPQPNCVATTIGTYTIETIHGARVMRFAGHPPITENILNYRVVYTELDWGGQNGRWVYRANELKHDLATRLTSVNRLDTTAWAAMKAQLGL